MMKKVEASRAGTTVPDGNYSSVKLGRDQLRAA